MSCLYNPQNPSDTHQDVLQKKKKTCTQSYFVEIWSSHEFQFTFYVTLSSFVSYPYSDFQMLMCYDPKFDSLRCLSASLCLKFFPRRTVLLVVGVDKYPLNRAIKLATLAERPLRALCWTWSLLHLLWSLLVGYSPHSCQPLRENISSVIPDKNGKNYQKALRWTQFGQRCRNKFLIFKLSH